MSISDISRDNVDGEIVDRSTTSSSRDPIYYAMLPSSMLRRFIIWNVVIIIVVFVVHLYL